MSKGQTRIVDVAGGKCAVTEAGAGPRLGVMPGAKGLPRWTPFLDRLAEKRTVVLVSLPGFPGSDNGYEMLDDQLDWVSAAQELIAAAGLEGCDLAASSTAAMVAADAAILGGGLVKRLSLTAPYGLFDADNPVADIFATMPPEQKALLSNDADSYSAAFGDPDAVDEVMEWRLTDQRALCASARIVWPLGDRGLKKRLPRLTIPTQLVWGGDDKVVPPSYADRFATAPGVVDRVVIPGAAHLAWIDQPDASADALLKFFD